MEVVANIISSKKESLALNSGGIALSVSKAKLFDECKARYRFSYIEKLPKKEWDFHFFGKLLHDTLETLHKGLVIDPDQNISTLMTDCFKLSLEKFGPKLTRENKIEAQNILKNYLEMLVSKQSIKKLPQIIALEKEFLVDIGHSVLLNGFIDRVEKDYDGIVHVSDYKTTKDKRYLKDFFQLLTYAFVMMLEDTSIQRVRASYILLRHNFKFMTKEYNRADVFEIQQKYLIYAEKIAEEKLWAPSPSRLCKYCDYVDNCKDGREYLRRIGLSKDEYGFTDW